MKKTRLKIKLHQITSRDEAELTVSDIALLTLNQLKTTATMDAQIAAVRSRHEAALAAFTEALKEKTDSLRAWAESNPDQFPKGQKSITFLQGTIGFRTGNPAVVLLNRSWTWKKVMDAIKQWNLDKLGWVRNKPEIDKDFILSRNRQAKDPADHAEKVLKPVGLKIAQDETFYVDPNLTELDLRQAVPSAAAF